MKKKAVLVICLALAALLCGCAVAFQPMATPEVTSSPTPTATPTPSPTPSPTPTPTLAPSPTPSPTPSPQPTSVVLTPKSQSQQAVPAQQAQPQATQAPARQSAMVWESATGSKYHAIPNCGRMDPSRARQVTVDEAKADGLEPCKKCHPPS